MRGNDIDGNEATSSHVGKDLSTNKDLGQNMIIGLL
jgi:hypothetical protein